MAGGRRVGPGTERALLVIEWLDKEEYDLTVCFYLMARSFHFQIDRNEEKKTVIA